MKTKQIILSLTFAVSTLMTGCNELRQDTAPKEGVKIFNTNFIPADYKISKRPDTLVAFLWPSEEYHQRYLAEGILTEADYQSFIAGTAKNVFLNGDKFDSLILENIEKTPIIEKEVALIDLEVTPIQTRVNEIQNEMDIFSGEVIKLEKLKKPFKRPMYKLRKKLKALKASISTNSEEFSTTNCAEVLNTRSGPNLQKCIDLDKVLKEDRAKLVNANQEYDSMSAEVAVLDTQIKKIKEEDIAPLFTVQDSIIKNELNPLLKAKDELLKVLTDITLNQANALENVQSALDPHAVVMGINDEGEEIRSIDESAQVNWIKTYDQSATKSNVFNIEGAVIHLEFNDWGESSLSYKTSYQKDEQGNILFDQKGIPLQAKNSDFSNVKVGARDVIEFEMLEKDVRGNQTGRIYKFKLQKSFFDVHVRLLGDLQVIYQGKVERRGQMKLVLPKLED
ncbi:MAG: hypothetical protein HN576_05835 [Bacteriovoracaceae bacterium]|jgi:hypothetical protein|nr:hypothetical protein [Bacteriovoracaceae bacterium]